MAGSLETFPLRSPGPSAQLPARYVVVSTLGPPASRGRDSARAYSTRRDLEAWLDRVVLVRPELAHALRDKLTAHDRHVLGA